MAVYQRKWKDPATGETKKTQSYYFEFVFAGQRIRECANTTRKSLAIEAEKRRKLELEQAIIGKPQGETGRGLRLRRVREVIAEYLEAYPINHRPASVRFATYHLGTVKKLIGELMVSDLSEARIKKYIASRLATGVGGRLVNIEVGELSRAIGKTWKVLWPSVRKLEERTDVGRALSPEEEEKLLAAARAHKSPVILSFIEIALMTGMRSGEILGLTWDQVNFEKRMLTVGRAKTKAGTGREIPASVELMAVLERHAVWYSKAVANPEPHLFLFSFLAKGCIYVPTKRMARIEAAWYSTLKSAGIQCRIHDLRHCAATKLSEAGVSEGTMKALMGHMSQAMLERYSHIRVAAKREAVEALSLGRKSGSVGGVPTKVPTQPNLM